MLQTIRVAGVAMALVVCAASATSYSSSYKDTDLGNGLFLVTVEVNSKTSMSTAREYALRRASEMCGGSGFTLVDAAANSTGPTHATAWTDAYGNTHVGTHGGGHDVSLLYRCNSGRGGARDNAPGGVNSLPRH